MKWLRAGLYSRNLHPERFDLMTAIDIVMGLVEAGQWPSLREYGKALTPRKAADDDPLTMLGGITRVGQ